MEFISPLRKTNKKDSHLDLKINYSSVIVVSITFLLFTLLFLYTGFIPKGNTVSHKFLSIELYDFDGNKTKLKNYQGKIIVLDFWATWCEPCKKAAPLIDILSKKSNTDNFVFLGVNTDDNKTLEELKQASLEFGINYPSLLDPKLKLSEELNVEGQPALIFLDRKGNILYRQYGILISDIQMLLQKMEEWEKE
ncbi:MAG: TlpA family protein disulfide reductase [Spirochaetia bacterium]|nr:TlpA family protein disulfide reductase [Spirochaetia bacterium]